MGVAALDMQLRGLRGDRTAWTSLRIYDERREIIHQ